MITFETIAELQKFVKVNDDVDIEYINPFIEMGVESLKLHIGADMIAAIEDAGDNAKTDALKRYVAAKAVLMSKGIQNVKMTRDGFTRYSEFSKNVIAASTDAMNMFAEDMESYVAMSLEYVLEICESIEKWSTSPLTTLNTHGWLKSVNDVERYIGARIDRLSFRKSLVMIPVFEMIVKRDVGKLIYNAVNAASENENVVRATAIYRNIICSAVVDRQYMVSGMYRSSADAIIMIANENKEAFGLSSVEYGITNLKGGIAL